MAFLGVIAGALRLVFSAVQSSNLYYIHGYMADAATDAEREAWSDILGGVFTVQNGINHTYDFFLGGVVLVLLVWMAWRLRRGPQASHR